MKSLRGRRHHAWRGIWSQFFLHSFPRLLSFQQKVGGEDFLQQQAKVLGCLQIFLAECRYFLQIAGFRIISRGRGAHFQSRSTLFVHLQDYGLSVFSNLAFGIEYPSPTRVPNHLAWFFLVSCRQLPARKHLDWKLAQSQNTL